MVNCVCIAYRLMLAAERQVCWFLQRQVCESVVAAPSVLTRWTRLEIKWFGDKIRSDIAGGSHIIAYSGHTAKKSKRCVIWQIIGSGMLLTTMYNLSNDSSPHGALDCGYDSACNRWLVQTIQNGPAPRPSHMCERHQANLTLCGKVKKQNLSQYIHYY